MADRSEEARLRAEAKFQKKEQQIEEGEKVWAEHLAAGKAADANRAKLKEQRLAQKCFKGQETVYRRACPRGRERGVLPTHRQVPTRAAQTTRKKERPSVK